MKRVIFFVLLLILLLFFESCEEEAEIGQSGNQLEFSFRPIEVKYPQTYADSSLLDTLFNTPVYTPYRWLEDLSSKDVQQWIADQNALTERYLSKLPFREGLKERLEALRRYETYSIARPCGSHFCFFRQNAEGEQAVLYRSETLFGENARPLLDPSYFSSDGSLVLGETAFSPDGRYLAFELKHSRSGWATIKVLDLESGEELPDRIQRVKNSRIAWRGKGFYYGCYAPSESGKGLPSEEFQEIRYHRLGSSQEEDALVFMDPSRPNLRLVPRTSRDGCYLFLEARDGNGAHSLYFSRLAEDSLLLFQTLVEGSSAEFAVVGTQGNSFYLLTNEKAPRYRLVRVYASHPDPAYWETVLPEDGERLQQVLIGKDRILAIYQDGLSSRLRQFDLNGRFGVEVEIPPHVYIDQLGSSGGEAPYFFRQQEFVRPARIFRLDDNSPIPRLLIAGKSNSDVDAYEVKQLFVKGQGGRVFDLPLVYKRGRIFDGSNPVLVYVRGSSAKPFPSYRSAWALLLEQGVLLAVVNLREGALFGESQKVTDDLKLVAEYLSKQRYSSYGKMALFGEKEGALWSAACLVQRPDLYRAVLLQDGIYDLLRLRFLGAAEAGPVISGDLDGEHAFDFLMSYSPLHGVEPLGYPAVFLSCSWERRDVSPAHTLKFAARLQAAQRSKTHPVLLSMGDSEVDRQVDMLSFMLHQTGEE